MVDAPLWHRLNPFHPRPPSSLKRDSAVDSVEATSSVHTGVPQLNDEHNERRRCTVHTPILLPETPSKHRRTPSILRTLAHHPSLSALRSRSKKAKKVKERSPSPPLPGHELRPQSEMSTSSSPTKLRSSSLKTTKSIPGNMRLSSEGPEPPRMADRAPLPPYPFLAEQKALKIRARRHRRSSSSATVVRRKTSRPAMTPDITIHGPDVTPESVKVRRMRFQFDFSVDGSPPSIMSSPKSQRKRAASTSHVDVSPTKPRGQNARNMSTPATPEPYWSRYASSSHPFTTQHPHPVPLTKYVQPPTFSPPGLLDHASKDFVPLTESGRTIPEDGLDTLVMSEALPTGTPGGRIVGLKRGVLSDGMKSEKDAIRFFSRETYDNVRAGSAASRSPAPAVAPIHTAIPYDPIKDRSECPFEVKLSPMVTKRMSLDAFGTPSPPISSMAVSPLNGMEELEEEDEQSGDSEAPAEAPCPHTTLSTIEEGSSARRDVIKTPASLGQAFNDTPVLLASKSDMPLPTDDSPFAPRPQRQYLSCPPLPIVQKLHISRGAPADAASTELLLAQEIIKRLEVELDEMHERAEKAEHLNTEEQAWIAKVKELEDLVEDRQDEYDDVNAQIREQARAHGIAVCELKTALEENEEYNETLQQAHDDLADRLAELEMEHAEMLLERASDASTLEKAHDDVRSLEARLWQHERDRSKAEAAIVELQQQLHAAENALQAKNDNEEKVQLDRMTAAEAERLERETMASELEKQKERVADLEDLLRAGIEREDEITRLKALMRTKDDRIIDLQSRQTERQRSLDSLQERLAEKDTTIASLKFSLEATELESRKFEKEYVAAVRSIAAKDMIIGVLRDKLSTTNFEKDELIAKSQLDSVKLEEVRVTIQSVKDELQTAQEKAGRLEGEVERLQEDLADARGKVEVNAEAKRQALEATEQLEAERREWEEERADLILKLDHAGMEVEDSQAVTAELEVLHQQLASCQSEFADVARELEDAHETLETRAVTIGLQDRELEFLRQALIEAEDAAESIGDGFLRRAKEAEREVESLRQQLSDLSEEVKRRDESVAQAFVRAETERASATDAKSRLSAFATEVDRLSLENAELRKQTDDERRSISQEHTKLAELEKKIETLEEDKELLNVALDSKQRELALLQRQLNGTPKWTGTLAASIGRMPRPAMEVTPVPVRTLSKSMPNTSLRAPRTGAMPATPTPLGPGTGIPRPKANAALTPLGVSTRYNKTMTPDTRSVKKVALVKPELGRRSSLPVLKGSSIDMGKTRYAEQMGSGGRGGGGGAGVDGH